MTCLDSVCDSKLPMCVCVCGMFAKLCFIVHSDITQVYTQHTQKHTQEQHNDTNSRNIYLKLVTALRHTHTYTHTHTHTNTNTCDLPTYTQTCAWSKWTNILMQDSVQVVEHEYISTYENVHTQKHTNIYTHPHTYTHTQTKQTKVNTTYWWSCPVWSSLRCTWRRHTPECRCLELGSVSGDLSQWDGPHSAWRPARKEISGPSL